MSLLESGYPRRALYGQLTWFGAWLGVTALGMLLHPSQSGHGTHEELGLPPCPMVILFDRPCPGCGLTTSWCALLHGRFGESFRAHPLGPLLYLLFSLSAFVALHGFLIGKRFKSENASFNRAVWIGVAIFVAFGVVRLILTPHYGTMGEHLYARFVR